MIHVLHGFLGSPSDFFFLKNNHVIFHDLYHMDTYPTLNVDDILIGYSMGGRIALDVARSVDFKIKKIVLISSHPGLTTNEEKEDRKKFEEKVLENLKKMERQDFLNWWNSLPIFQGDEPIDVTADRYLKSYELFKKYRLSEQDNYQMDILKNKDKFLYLAGEYDEKYKAIANDMFLASGLKVKLVSGGHRLFQKREEILKVLKEEGIL